jgi:pimeloyl-ACP methyl ester carboxylesterase
LRHRQTQEAWDSSRPADGYDNGTVASDVIELLDSRGVQYFYLVGHDWGGPVAFAATLLARDRVRKLALVDTVLLADARLAAAMAVHDGTISSIGHLISPKRSRPDESRST